MGFRDKNKWDIFWQYNFLISFVKINSKIWYPWKLYVPRYNLILYDVKTTKNYVTVGHLSSFRRLYSLTKRYIYNNLDNF